MCKINTFNNEKFMKKDEHLLIGIDFNNLFRQKINPNKMVIK